jgi:hypothetical protein
VATDGEAATRSNKSSPARRASSAQAAHHHWRPIRGLNSGGERQKRQTIDEQCAVSSAHLLTYLGKGLARRTTGCYCPGRLSQRSSDRRFTCRIGPSVGTPISGRNWQASVALTTGAVQVRRGRRGPAILATTCTRNSRNPVVSAGPAVRKPGRHRPPRRQALTRVYLGPLPPTRALTSGAAYRAPLPPGGLGSASRPPEASPSQSAARASLRSR